MDHFPITVKQKHDIALLRVKIQNFIARDKLGEAIHELTNWVRDYDERHPFTNELIILAANAKTFKEYKRQKQFTFEEETREGNKLRNQVLNILDSLEDDIQEGDWYQSPT